MNKFKIENKEEEKMVKTIRLPKSLVNKIEVLANKNNITFTKFIIQAINYALDNM